MYEDIKKDLEHPNTLTGLRFRSFENEGIGILKVTYHGHEEGGSYVYAKEVAPKYVEDLQYSCNRIVKWTDHTSGDWFGSDTYHFDVLVNKIFDENKYKPVGDLLRVSNCYFAFEKDCGHDWALLYILHRALLDNSIPESVGIKIKKDKKSGKDVIYFNNTKVAIIVEYEDETYHNFQGHGTSKNRTRFHATYDLLIPKIFRDLYFEKYKEIVNSYFGDVDVKCMNVHIRHDWTYGDKIIIGFDNGIEFKVGSNWYIFGKNQAEKIIEKVKKNYVFIPVVDKRGMDPFCSYQTMTMEFETSPKLKDIIDGVIGKRNYMTLDGIREKFYKVEVNHEKVNDLEMVLKSNDMIIISR